MTVTECLAHDSVKTCKEILKNCDLSLRQSIDLTLDNPILNRVQSSEIAKMQRMRYAISAIINECDKFDLIFQ